MRYKAYPVPTAAADVLREAAEALRCAGEGEIAAYQVSEPGHSEDYGQYLIALAAKLAEIAHSEG